jgi:hypothetical protein
MTAYSEIEAELRHKDIMDEMDVIRLEEEAIKGKTLLDKNLALLGRWMISAGEKLRNRHRTLQETSSGKLINKAA